jgi:threonine dehydrogenase-like Zn-dependent dehydrogenase
MQPGYICGHEGTGIVAEVGDAVANFKRGDHVIAPFTISWYHSPFQPWKDDEINLCPSGVCFNCTRGITGRCAKGKSFGTPVLDGSQAEYFRVPMADTTLFHAPPESADLGELPILMTDIFATG